MKGWGLLIVHLRLNTTFTIPYYNPNAMAHVLLTLNEPLLQCSRDHEFLLEHS